MLKSVPMVIDFHATGGVEAMHREDVLPLGFLGAQEITRATDIRFDSAAQKWSIWLAAPDGDGFCPPVSECALGFDTYEYARTVEVAWLEKARLEGIAPGSVDGIRILRMVRRPPRLASTG